MKRLLIVYHTQFGATKQLAEAAAGGARRIDDVETILARAADAGVVPQPCVRSSRACSCTTSAALARSMRSSIRAKSGAAP